MPSLSKLSKLKEHAPQTKVTLTARIAALVVGLENKDGTKRSEVMLVDDSKTAVCLYLFGIRQGLLKQSHVGQLLRLENVEVWGRDGRLSLKTDGPPCKVQLKPVGKRGQAIQAFFETKEPDLETFERLSRSHVLYPRHFLIEKRSVSEVCNYLNDFGTARTNNINFAAVCGTLVDVTEPRTGLTYNVCPANGCPKKRLRKQECMPEDAEGPTQPRQSLVCERCGFTCLPGEGREGPPRCQVNLRLSDGGVERTVTLFCDDRGTQALLGLSVQRLKDMTKKERKKAVDKVVGKPVTCLHLTVSHKRDLWSCQAIEL